MAYLLIVLEAYCLFSVVAIIFTNKYGPLWEEKNYL